MIVAPRVAPLASPVTVSGGGCNSNVDVVETAFLPFVQPRTINTQTAIPDATGAWSVGFAMPSAPAYVIATCDGVPSAPVMVAPTDVIVGDMTYASLTLTEIVITASPLVEGTEFAVFDQSSQMLGTSVAAFGTATVRLSRSFGPAQVIAVGLRLTEPGFPVLPYLSIARRIQLPLPSLPSVVVSPRVTSVGTEVEASGSCSGSPHLIVTARAVGWLDIPPELVDVVLPTDSTGSWATSFRMPLVPSTVSVFCTKGVVTEIATTLISPADGLISLIAQRDGSGVVVTIANVISPERLAAFTATGKPLPLAILATLNGGVQVRLEPQGIPVRIVIVGIESLGENAQARQTSPVQGWSVDVGTIMEIASTTGLVPAQRISLLGTACCPQPAVRIPQP